MNNRQVISIGIALFAMFFGAGNVVFPLDVGRIMGDKVYWALFGLLISAIIMPITGVFGAAVFDGDYHAFFRRIGTIPGELLALLCMLVIGPFGAIPRTITVAHGAFSWYFPVISLFAFSLVAAALILFLALKEDKVIDVVGKILGPFKIILISAVIVSGFFVAPTMLHTNFLSMQSFLKGLREGYMTLDLLGAMFLAKLIWKSIDRSAGESSRSLLIGLMKGGVVGGFLLGIIYVGFMLVGAFHGIQISQEVGRQQFIYALADFLMGRFGVVSSFTVALACLVTAIALTAIFADYVRNIILQVFGEKISYKSAVFGSVLITTIMANLGFEGIMNILAPIAIVCYPAIIVLTLCNIAYKTVGFKLVKAPFYATLLISIVIKYLGIM